MTAHSELSAFDRSRWLRLADWLAVSVAVSLPWSTSATSILIALWLIVALPFVDFDMLRRELTRPAGGLPILLCMFAVVGMLWADVSWSERLASLKGFHRLLIIPLLFVQFRRSEHGAFVLRGFLASATCLLAASWAFALLPALEFRGAAYGVPVKDYIFQSDIFLVCAFALVGAACEFWRKGEGTIALGLVSLSAFFLVDIFFVATARTVLLVAPVLALLLGWREFGWKGLVGAGLLGCILGASVWFGSSYLRERMVTSVKELQAYRNSGDVNSTALHLEFLRKSLSFVAAAPIIGHGTGSIPEQFSQAAVGQTGAAAVTIGNPHDQIFAVAIQLGLIGATVLLAMWTAHFMLFRGGGLTAWIGAIIVTTNVVGSPFNTHLFDFNEGWLYAFGLGVAGGMVLKRRRSPIAAPRGTQT